MSGLRQMFNDIDWNEIAMFSGEFADFEHYEDLINTILSIVCVISAGLAAGLTMGLLSLDVTKLEIKAMTGSAIDRADAEAILPIVKKHHLLLVTLLLFNSMANEALPVFLSALLPEWLSVLVSVTLVLLFGEILPSAFFTGKAQLHTAAIMIPFVKGLTVFFWPIGYPLSKALDYCFGMEEETSVISREELGALVYLQNSDRSKRKDSQEKIHLESRHQSTNANPNIQHATSMDSFASENSDDTQNGLSMYEINIMTGILKLSKLQVKDSMINIKNVFMISDSTRLDSKTLESLWNSGFSRIPVFKRRDKQHIVGYLLIKSLILISADDKVPVETLPIRQPFFVKPGLRLLEMLSMFREGRCHLALVTEDPIAAMSCMAEGKRPGCDSCNVIGIVTLEDVIEEILQGEITDETDAMPSIFPNGGNNRPGGAMGILSMGRSSMMHRTRSSQSITKMEDKDKKLVKRSVSYATHGGNNANNGSGNNGGNGGRGGGGNNGNVPKRNNSISTKEHPATNDEKNSRRNWQQRNHFPLGGLGPISPIGSSGSSGSVSTNSGSSTFRPSGSSGVKSGVSGGEGHIGGMGGVGVMGGMGVGVRRSGGRVSEEGKGLLRPKDTRGENETRSHYSYGAVSLDEDSDNDGGNEIIGVDFPFNRSPDTKPSPVDCNDNNDNHDINDNYDHFYNDNSGGHIEMNDIENNVENDVENVENKDENGYEKCHENRHEKSHEKHDERHEKRHENDGRIPIDSYESGAQGYRIITNMPHLNFDDDTVEEKADSGDKTFLTV